MYLLDTLRRKEPAAVRRAPLRGAPRANGRKRIVAAGGARIAASAGNSSYERLRHAEQHRLAERVRELRRDRADAARRRARTS